MSIMQTLMVNTKFTVIASSSRSNLSSAVNMVRYSNMMVMLKSLLPAKYHDTIQPVTGFYCEAGVEYTDYNQCFEQSVMFGLYSEAALTNVVRLFCSTYGQDCVLVQNNDTGEIMLVGLDWSETIGTKWINTRINMQDDDEMANFVAVHNAFTVLPDGSIVEVLA